MIINNTLNTFKKWNLLQLIIIFLAISGGSLLYNHGVAGEKGVSAVNMEDPVQFLHSKIDQVLTELKASHNNKNNLQNIIKIVDNLIMPNVDFDSMCQKIAGRGIWDKASKNEKQDFIKELKNLLIKTYAFTLKNYTEEKIEFQNYTGKLDTKRVQIKSTIIKPDQKSLAVDYRLVAIGNSWKVYDLIIEGVSILNGFTSQFSDDIRMNGLRFVTNKIKDHNDKNIQN